MAFDPLAVILWMAGLPAGPTLFTLLVLVFGLRFGLRRLGF
jgi:hypothetical protein